jgi:quercetin dioxygenase-like cupin family protein
MMDAKVFQVISAIWNIGGLMKIINVNQVGTRDVSGDPLFFGGKVTTQPILEEAHEGKRIQVIMVNFAPGARNKLHTHLTEQILIITEGKGIVATKNEEHTVTPGMIVYIEPNEEHWHGATNDSIFSHLSILGDPHKFKE